MGFAYRCRALFRVSLNSRGFRGCAQVVYFLAESNVKAEVSHWGDEMLQDGVHIGFGKSEGVRD